MPARWIGLCALSAALGVGIGRYSVPAHVEEHRAERTHEVEHVASSESKTSATVDVSEKATASAKDVIRVTSETRKPNGEVRTVTRVEYREREATHVAAAKTEVQTVVRTETRDRIVDHTVTVDRIVERDAPRWSVGAGVGTGWRPSPVYTADVAYRVAGPLSFMVWGTFDSRPVVGVGLRLSF